MMGRWLDALKAYAHHDDPRTATANLVALVVASNQPFYPLYIWWVVSPTIWPSFLTFLSTPFFLAVPAVSRRSPFFGKLLLPVTGIVNGVVTAKAFGIASGVELFLLPCVLLGFVLFRPAQRFVGFALAGVALALFMLVRDRYGAPLHFYAPGEYAAFMRLNAISVGTLTAFIGILVSGWTLKSDPG